MIVPVQLAHTLNNGTFSVLSNWRGRILMEIGSSDRYTVDLDILPRISDAFLITAEPLLEKVSRAICRRRPSDQVLDYHEPLGQQHDRGIVLPVAVGPTSNPDGELQPFRVGNVAGCSSLLNLSKTRASFGSWCLKTADVRQVWTVSLFSLLGRLPRHSRVFFAKLDCQGFDLQVFQSAGKRMEMVDFVSMEVVSDDCRPLYANQPKCTEIVAAMGASGFSPLGPVRCVPSFPRRSQRCELDIVFKNAAAESEASDVIYEHHKLFHNGCEALHNHQPTGKLYVVRGMEYRLSSQRFNHSAGRLYSCPASCAESQHAPAAPCPW